MYAVTVDGVVRYIGKGRRYRVREHYRIARLLIAKRSVGKKIKANRFYNLLAQAINSGRHVDEVIVAEGLSDQDAFSLERDTIAQYSTDQLWNVAPGGEGYDSERAKAAWTEERRQKQRDVAKRRWDDPKERERHSETIRSQWKDAAYRQHHIAKQKQRWSSPEAKARGSAVAKALWDNPERRKRISEQRSELWSRPERRAQRSAQSKAMWADPARRAE